MTTESIIAKLAELNPKAFLADGFNDALVGYVSAYPHDPVALYDRWKCIEILMVREAMTTDEAEDYFELEIAGSNQGPGTPAFCVMMRSVE